MRNQSIAVVIPAYNSAYFIAETLDSILGQTLLPDEVIVVDDGSTDETAAVVESYGGIVRCYRTDNGGQGRARALAISLASAEWIALCDSDDLWNPDHLARRTRLLECYPSADLTFSDFYSFGPDADPTHALLNEAPEQWIRQWVSPDGEAFYCLNDPYLAVLQFNPAYLSGVMFRLESYLRMGGFKEKYSRWIGEDSEFIRRFSALEGALFVGDTQQTWGYRRHGHNYSLIQWRNINAKADILDAQLADGVIPAHYRQATLAERDRTRRRAFDQACWERAQGDISTLFDKLPASARTLKRRAKRHLAKVGVFP